MHEYKQWHRFFAQIADKMEQLGASELAELGAKRIKTKFRGIFFETDAAGLYRINYRARLLTRVLAPLKTFQCHSTRYLYNTARSIAWDDFLTPDDTFAIFANVSNSHITHSKYAALRLKDAIVDHFRDATGKRPSIDVQTPDVWFGLHIENNRATISIDTSGGSLHRRGYRQETIEAPMQETLAAAIIRLSGWDGSRPLCDPMCGSGTLLCEALMHFCRIPAGFLRAHFGFERLPDFDANIWATVKAKADAQIRDLPNGLIQGSDISYKAIAAARINTRLLPHGEKIVLRESDFRVLEELRDTVLVTNPPYGVRLGNKRETAALLQAFGRFLKQRCQGSTAFIYFGDPEMASETGLKPAKKFSLKNAAMAGQLRQFQLFPNHKRGNLRQE